jgi:hypothetical protein
LEKKAFSVINLSGLSIGDREASEEFENGIKNMNRQS